jgi:hypothetical protein
MFKQLIVPSKKVRGRIEDGRKEFHQQSQAAALIFYRDLS